MTGVATMRCSIGILALALAGCAGMTRDDDGLGSGGAAHANPDGAAVGGSGGAGASGGRSARGGTSASGGTSATNSGGTSGVNAGGGAGLCSYEKLATSDPSVFSSVARVDLPTLCGLGGPTMCGFSAAQLLEGFECSPAGDGDPNTTFYFGKFHVVGCGNETVGYNGGYGGPTETFSLSTGERVGATLSSDVPFGLCESFRYVTGQTHLDCPGAAGYSCVPSVAPGDAGAETCTDSDLKLLLQLRGRPECDCSHDPGVDPCFGPTSCECWCSKFVPAARACPGWASTG